MRLAHYFSDGIQEFNSANFRTMISTRALIRSGWDVRLLHIQHWMENSPESRRACASADIIILQRVLVEQSIDQAVYWQKRGKAVIVDFDDAYQLIQDDNQAFSFWGQGEVEVSGPYNVKYKKKLDKHPVEQFTKALEQIAGATMPSRVLQQDWLHAGRCWYLPNYADSERYQAYRAFVNPDPYWITMGYGGSMSHVPSFELSGIETALQKVTQRNKRVRVAVCGDQRVYDRLPVAAGQKYHVPYVRWDEWPGVLGTFDIGLAPMARHYDDSRSWIKAMEYGLMQIPFVATKSPAYRDFIEAGIGLYAPGGDDREHMPERTVAWVELLTDMIDHLDAYKEKARNDLEFVYHLTDVIKNVGAIKQVYNDVVNYAG